MRRFLGSDIGCAPWVVNLIASGRRRASKTAFPRRASERVEAASKAGEGVVAEAILAARHGCESHFKRTTQSVEDGIPTRSVGTSRSSLKSGCRRFLRGDLGCAPWVVNLIASGRRRASKTAFPRGAWERVASHCLSTSQGTVVCNTLAASDLRVVSSPRAFEIDLKVSAHSFPRSAWECRPRRSASARCGRSTLEPEFNLPSCADLAAPASCLPSSAPHQSVVTSTNESMPA